MKYVPAPKVTEDRCFWCDEPAGPRKKLTLDRKREAFFHTGCRKAYLKVWGKPTNYTPPKRKKKAPFRVAELLKRGLVKASA